MKKILLSVFLFFSLLNISFATGFSTKAGPINHIVFFGDSLSDNGNVYKLFLGRLPKSPPYFEGRFTNGFTWAEDFANYFYDKYYIDSKNYAYGGATTIWHPPKIKFIAPTTLLLELNQYLTDAMLQNKSDTLFSIWIGGNDYLFDQTNPNEMTTQVVNELVKTINTLYDQQKCRR